MLRRRPALFMALILVVGLLSVGWTQGSKQLGEWRDYIGDFWDNNLLIEEAPTGDVTLVVKPAKGDSFRRELEEVSAQATERRRFRDVESGEIYVIQAANGDLGLHDESGFIRAATKVP